MLSPVSKSSRTRAQELATLLVEQASILEAAFLDDVRCDDETRKEMRRAMVAKALLGEVGIDDEQAIRSVAFAISRFDLRKPTWEEEIEILGVFLQQRLGL